jgi:hypothetical protein
MKDAPKLDLQVLDLSFNKLFGSALISWLFLIGCNNMQCLALKVNTSPGIVAKDPPAWHKSWWG